jgi:hypothetical protein
MKAKRNSSTKKKDKIPNLELDFYRDAATHLVSNKIFCDYLNASNSHAVEPEHFVEDWIKKTIIKPTTNMKKMIWRYFMENLLGYRRFQNYK